MPWKYNIEFDVLFTNEPSLTEIKGVSQEVLVGSDATISCKITGITQPITVKWKIDVETVIPSTSKYIVNTESFDQLTNSQVTTLTVRNVSKTADTVFTCEISSLDWEHSDDATSVTLGVFGMFLWYDTCTKAVSISANVTNSARRQI